jgi:hypothetical protein
MLIKANIYLIIAFTLIILSFSTGYGGVVPLESIYTGTLPSIDGSYTLGEWPSTAALEIGPSTYPIHTKVYISNNNNLYMFVDAADAGSGDYTEEDLDHCTVYLYKNGNGVYKGLRVTVFGNGATLCEYTNDTNSSLNWTSLASCPAGVKAKAGFGQGPDIAPNHRMYEFEIPLSIIGAIPGDIIDFASPYDQTDSLPFDYNNGSSRFNIWPPATTANDLTTWGQIQLASNSSIPTMNEWGMIIFMVLAGLGSVYYMRRRRKAES